MQRLTLAQAAQVVGLTLEDLEALAREGQVKGALLDTRGWTVPEAIVRLMAAGGAEGCERLRHAAQTTASSERRL